MASTASHTILPAPTLEGPVRLLIVVAPYYRTITDLLLAGARAAADAAGAEIEVVNVPGALEIPPAIALAEHLAEYDGYVALGCVMRGETTHYDTVCNDSSRGLMLLGLEGACIGNAILTVENHAQAEVRADPAQQDKGGAAVEAALHLIALARKWGDAPKGIGFVHG